MPKAVVINPNTSPAMTEEIKQTATRVFQPPMTVEVVMAPAGPESLESWRDYSLASVAILPALDRHADADGYLLACFGDPGLYLLKEICPAPVIGIAEASMSLALLLGGRFGILAGMPRAVQLMDSIVRTYGLESRYAGTIALDMRVLDFEQNHAETLAILESRASALVRQGADVLLLGCAGLTVFSDEMQRALAVPVIDPVEAGCRTLQSIIESKLPVSHAGIYTRPAPQRMNSLEDIFSAPMSHLLKSWEQDQH